VSGKLKKMAPQYTPAEERGDLPSRRNKIRPCALKARSTIPRDGVDLTLILSADEALPQDPFRSVVWKTSAAHHAKQLLSSFL